MEIGGFDGLNDFSGGLKIEKISEDDDEFIPNENQKNDRGIIKLEVKEESSQGGVAYFIFQLLQPNLWDKRTVGSIVSLNELHVGPTLYGLRVSFSAIKYDSLKLFMTDINAYSWQHIKNLELIGVNSAMAEYCENFKTLFSKILDFLRGLKIRS